MGQHKFKKRNVSLSEVVVDQASPLLPPTDERLVQLIKDVQTGKAPSWKTTARLADLGVHHPPTLASARAAMRSDPEYSKYRTAFMEHAAEERPWWIVYRDESGRLVMFDDYASYVVAQETGVTMVDVTILGEAEPTTKP